MGTSIEDLDFVVVLIKDGKPMRRIVCNDLMPKVFEVINNWFFRGEIKPEFYTAVQLQYKGQVVKNIDLSDPAQAGMFF